MSLATVLSGTPAGLKVPSANVSTITVANITAGGPQGGMAITTNPAPGSLAGVLINSLDVADQTAFTIAANSAPTTSSSWNQYVAGTAAGGLSIGHFQLYNNTTTAGVAAPALQVIDADNADGSVRANVRPLVFERVGTITATGALQTVPVAGMTAASRVFVSVVGSTGAVPVGGLGAAPVVAFNGAIVGPVTVGFDFTGTNTLIYSYYVLG
jgi:hypothetical protein